VEGTHLTYGELNRRANQLARRLRARGIGRNAPVGICLERSPAMIVGWLAILKAGGAYVPLDPADPPARRAFMTTDTGLRVVVTTPDHATVASGHGRGARGHVADKERDRRDERRRRCQRRMIWHM
jgi:non-ribosomal peptide synthetase component F